MKFGIFFIFIFTFLIVAAVGFYFFIIEKSLEKSIVENNGDYVVLLHGLGRSSLSMQKIGIYLSKKGYKIINMNYPSRSDNIENLVEYYLKKELKDKYTDRTKKINFVTHSMGGIMVRYFLANNEMENLGRVVMLAPPNKGSEKVDDLRNSNIMNFIMGPAVKEMATDKSSFVNRLSFPEYEVGIIAGEYDKKVSVEKTKLENMKDFFVVKESHTFIMRSGEVIDAVECFLEFGRF